MNKIRITATSILTALALLITPLVITGNDVFAECTAGSSPKECAGTGVNATTPAGDGARTSLQTRIATIVNILLFVLGAIAVIMIVIGGIRYTLSNGDSSAITSAKNTILYAVIGLVVALLAYAIVNFVLGAF